uniref:Hydrolase_4 domain-containing protein n=1 Tax=Globodera pallida TaxID=36090 RepID=A0A183CDK2_GLOPA
MPALAQHLAGLLLLSPAVGMELPNYVHKVLPDRWDALRAGLPVDHPSADRAVRLRVSMDSLLDYEKNCILRRDASPPTLNFPIRIVHGLHDKLVPVANGVELLRRLPSPDKAMHVVPCGHVITDTSTVVNALDCILAQICREDNAPQQMTARNAKVPEAILR